MQHRPRKTDVIRECGVAASTGISGVEPGMLPVIIDGAGMLGINGSRVLVLDELFHYTEGIYLTVVEPDFGVLFVWLFYLDVPEVYVIDAISRSEVAADFDGILPHFAGHTTIESNAVRGTVHDANELFPSGDSPHDLSRPTA